MNESPSATLRTVRVELAEQTYDIDIGTGLLAESGPRILQRVVARHVVIISDDHVREPCAVAVAESLADSGADVDVLSVPAGEPTKSVEALAALWQEVLDTGATRQTLLAAVGGGVIGDLAGFVAASFARGIPFVQVPTTLLAQVDSSVGGKVGINLPRAKNMVGAFWQPRYVLIDTDVLHTLPEREYRAGLAEVVKYAVIMDEAFFQFLEAHAVAIQQREPAVVRQIVARCCRLKADVVQADPREISGRRAILNYGHTFGHALEALLGYGQLLHGEGVAIGMICASRLAESLGRIDAEVTIRQEKLLTTFGLPTRLPSIDQQEMLDHMWLDKKVMDDQLRFVLPSRLGHVELVSVAASAVQKSLAG